MKIFPPPIKEPFYNIKNTFSTVWVQWFLGLQSTNNTLINTVDEIKDKEADALLDSASINYSKRIEEIEAKLALMPQVIDFQKRIDDLNLLLLLLERSDLNVVTGVWSPVYGCQTGSFATMTMDATGSYYKLGKLVYFTCDVKTDNVDATGASGYLYITGLPFVPSSSASLVISYVSGWAGEHPIVATLASLVTSNIALRYRSAVDGADSLTQVSDMTTGAVANQNRVIISGCYLS